VGVERRSARSWISLISSVLAAVGFSLALVMQGGIAVTFGALCAGLLIIAFAFRPRAARPRGAIYSGSADLFTPEGKKLPGQLSFSSTAITWTPNHHSQIRGASGISVPVDHDLTISLRRGAGLLDVIVTTGSLNGEEQRFLAHQSRRLRRAVDKVTG
jgi:hypothetical protein